MKKICLILTFIVMTVVMNSLTYSQNEKDKKSDGGDSRDIKFEPHTVYGRAPAESKTGPNLNKGEGEFKKIDGGTNPKQPDKVKIITKETKKISISTKSGNNAIDPLQSYNTIPESVKKEAKEKKQSIIKITRLGKQTVSKDIKVSTAQKNNGYNLKGDQCLLGYSVIMDSDGNFQQSGATLELANNYNPAGVYHVTAGYDSHGKKALKIVEDKTGRNSHIGNGIPDTKGCTLMAEKFTNNECAIGKSTDFFIPLWEKVKKENGGLLVISDPQNPNEEIAGIENVTITEKTEIKQESPKNLAPTEKRRPPHGDPDI